jgi:FkbM family methyltransferase
MSLVSFAQAGEDVLLHRALGHIAHGFWVDVGAGDPIADSVTAHFSALGWRGINIEPDPAAFGRLVAARPRDVTLPCAAGAVAGRAVLHRIPDTGLSTLDPAIAARHAEDGLGSEPQEVEVRTLAALCDAHAPADIHLLKVDAEGHEAAVLAGADFARHRPWVVVVEATEPNRTTPSHAAWEPGLLAAGYVFAWFDGLNRWYLAEEKADGLSGAFTAPPNPHDGFVRHAERAWRERAEAAEAWARQEATARAAAETAVIEATRASDSIGAQLDAAAAWHEAALRSVTEAAATLEASRVAAIAAAMADARAAEARAHEAEATHAAAAERAEAEAARTVADLDALRLHLATAEAERDAALLALGEARAELAARDAAQQAAEAAAEARIAAAEARAAEALGRAEALERSIATQGARPSVAPGQATLGQAAPSPSGGAEPALRIDAAGLPSAAATPRDRRPICVDVTLTLRHGANPAVGLVRVEHDVARHLLSLPGPGVLPVICDANGHYRLATASERARLDAILTAREEAAPDTSAWQTPAAQREEARWADAMAVVRRIAAGDPGLRASMTAGLQARGRVPRWLAWGISHGAVLGARSARTLLDRPRHDAGSALPAPGPPPPKPLPLPAGAVLVSAGNQWDYLDYGWMAREVGAGALSAVTVLYDVIAADLPWVTPAPADLYHRHWVEIGHLSRRLVAISEHTARQYRALIAGPNLIEVPLEACPLPLALVARAASLSARPVATLEGRRFVLYVSTIETRKNHHILLHAWDRLLRELPPDQVPQLVFVGSWGWGTESTRLMVERNWRIAEHVQVLGGVPDEALLWLYRNALLAVFPALAEGFGLGAAEAVALGTPCLVSHCPALIEATQGLMPALDPLDLPGWVAALRRLITDPDALAALGARTAEFVPLPEGAFREAVARAAIEVAEGR